MAPVQPPHILFTADDFGARPAINAAVAQCIERHAINSISLVMGQPSTGEAITIARSATRVIPGIHLFLEGFTTLNIPNWPAWMLGPVAALALNPALKQAVHAELTSQFAAYRASGLPLAHISFHHHLLLHPPILGALLDAIPSDFNGWIRFGAPRCPSSQFLLRPICGLVDRGLVRTLRSRIPCAVTDTLWRFLPFGADQVSMLLPSLPAGSHEFIFHPENPGDIECRTLLSLAQTHPSLFA